MKYKIALVFIIIAAFFLRFFQLGTNPPSLTWDEVALGYNAYSLGIDLRDEFGTFLPLASLESFGDYKPPVYAYLDIFPIKLFGLTSFAVRFPSAFLGVMTVLLTYFLTLRIFYRSDNKKLYALCSMLVLALSPWHIMLSRAAFEANVATFFIVLGVYTFLTAVQGRKWMILLSAVSFVLAMYSFNSARIIVPLLVFALSCLCLRPLLKDKRQTIIAGVLGLVMILPLVAFLRSPQAGIRFQEVNIFSDLSLVEYSNQSIANDDNAVWSKLIHNHRVVYGLAFLQHYLDHFNPNFLFITGDVNPKFSTHDLGQLYLWELPFLVVGLLFLFRKREGYWWVIPLWLVIGIIPAGTAKETPHALRMEAVLPTLQLIVGYGLVSSFGIIASLRSSLIRKVILSASCLVLVISVFYFQYGYFKHYSSRFSKDWQYGYEELINVINENKFAQTIVFDSGHLGRPYIYYLFYNKVDPRDFRQTMDVTRDNFGFVDVKGFGEYRFTRKIGSEVKSSNNIYVGSPKDVPENSKVLKKIKTLDGLDTLVVYTY